MPRTTTTPGVGAGIGGAIAHPDADPLPPGVAAARAVVVITKTTTAPGTPLTGVRGEDEVLDADALSQGVGAARLERPRRDVTRQGPIVARRPDAVGRPRRRAQLERRGAAM